MTDITYDNFETALVGASMQTPVLLDIWAPWCGPCRQLGPMLEQLEQDYAGRFILAKLNADEVPDIAGQLSQMFGVRSIPFCVMFVQGQAVDGFVGAMPQAEIQAFLDKHVLPAVLQDTPDIDAHSENEQPLSATDRAAAAPVDPMHALMDALAQQPNDTELRLTLVRAQVALGDWLSAQTTFAPLEAQASGLLANPRFAAHAHYLAALSAAQQARSIEALQALLDAHPRDFVTRFELAQVHFAAGRFTQAMDDLLEIIMRDKAWQDGLARQTYVAILEVMTPPPEKTATGSKKGAGTQAPTKEKDKPALALAGAVHIPAANPVIDKYRRKLSMAVF